jgi:hypothetical protein
MVLEIYAFFAFFRRGHGDSEKSVISLTNFDARAFSSYSRALDKAGALFTHAGGIPLTRYFAISHSREKRIGRPHVRACISMREMRSPAQHCWHARKPHASGMRLRSESVIPKTAACFLKP